MSMRSKWARRTSLLGLGAGGLLLGLIGCTPEENNAPVVSAGPDRTGVVDVAVSLDATVTDDGRPSPSGLTTTWAKGSGPGNVVFGDVTAVDTTATFDAVGTYVLRLMATDGELTTTADVTVTVTATAPVNVAPTVSAGADRTGTVGDAVTLDGTVTDDGLPAPANLSQTWSKVSGPGNAVFANATAVDTTATFDAAGTYVVRLTATDGTLSASDEATVTIAAPAPTGPAVSTFGSANYTPGTRLAVSLAVTPPTGTGVYAVEDAPPAGWTVSSISDGGTFDAVNNKVKWGPFFDSTARTLTYEATPPAGTTGTQTFTGTASFDGTDSAIVGNRTINP